MITDTKLYPHQKEAINFIKDKKIFALYMEMGLGKTRTIFRMNLIRRINMSDKNIKEIAKLIKKANPMFIELKGYMSVGFARERLGYNRMPNDKEMLEFSKKLAKETGLKILDTHEFSRAIVLGKNKRDLKII